MPPDRAATTATSGTASWRPCGLLPVRQRAVLVLRYYEDLSEADIAVALGCSPGTVNSHASRALRTLREHLPDTDREGTMT